MNISEKLKDVINIVMKMDNIDLARQLLDVQQQALDLQEESFRLRTQIQEMKENERIESEVERHSQPYITFASDKDHIPYCATCWGVNRQKIQMKYWDEERLQCPSCGTIVYKETPHHYYY